MISNWIVESVSWYVNHFCNYRLCFCLHIKVRIDVTSRSPKYIFVWYTLFALDIARGEAGKVWHQNCINAGASQHWNVQQGLMSFFGRFCFIDETYFPSYSKGRCNITSYLTQKPSLVTLNCSAIVQSMHNGVWFVDSTWYRVVSIKQ